ncbi:MAG TPA: TetR/AcrR family transcriptional regulator [Solirubrobacteraceae bacterium]|jgi:TetR/AcrR family transcriptional repressor of nem operon
MVPGPTPTESRTAERVLDVAEGLMQTRGFNSFSYADIARELGVTTASLHYHFPGKAELGRALIVRYSERFAAALGQIYRDVPDGRARLAAYAALYADVLRNNRLCMCGILAAEYQTLPQPMREAVIRFFDDNQTWLVSVLAEGLSERTLTFTGPPDDVAQSILSTLEGAMLVARPYGDTARFDASARQLLAGLAA